MRWITISLLGVLCACGNANGERTATADGSVDAAVQRLLVTPDALSIPEGATSTLGVSLAVEPSTPVIVTLASTNDTSVSLSPDSITFIGGPHGNWQAPMQVAVSAPIDKNNISEIATITLVGDGAGEPVSIPATVRDETVLQQYGWPAPPTFTGSAVVASNFVVAYQITMDSGTNLDAFGVFSRLEVRDSLFRIALYRDAGGRPGQIVAQMHAPVTLGAGTVRFDLQPDVAIDKLGSPMSQQFWLAFEASMGANLRASNTITTSRCAMSVANVTDPWPPAFDPRGCDTGPAINIWIDTYHQ